MRFKGKIKNSGPTGRTRSMLLQLVFAKKERKAPKPQSPTVPCRKGISPEMIREAQKKKPAPPKP